MSEMDETFLFKWPMNQIDGENHYNNLSNVNIYITGDFDNWGKTTKMAPNFKAQVYEVELPIDQFDHLGRFNFKFYIQDYDSWRCNPLYPTENDGNGNENNYITGSEMIKQAELVELERRKNHEYCEAEAINEEIINELQVSSSDNEESNVYYDNRLKKKEEEEKKMVEEYIREEEKVDISKRLQEIESEKKEFHEAFEEDREKHKDSVSESVTEFMKMPDTNKNPTNADISFFPTENETLEEAIAKNEEHVPILVHNPDQEDNVINEPTEALVPEEDMKENKQSENVGDEKDNDIDDIPTENRRKLKIKRKVKRNKRTGERIVVSEEIYELDEDDNIIGKFASMEEVEKSRVPEEVEAPRERLFEIENVNEGEMTSNPSVAISPHEDEALPVIEESDLEEEDTSSGEEAEIPRVEEIQPVTEPVNEKENIDVPKDDAEEANIPQIIDNEEGEPIESENVNEDKPVDTLVEDKPIVDVNPVEEGEETGVSGNVPGDEPKDTPMANEEATFVAEDNTPAPTESTKPKKAKENVPKTTQSTPAATTDTSGEKKKGFLKKLKRTFF